MSRRKKNPLVRRQEALTATMERYRHRAFDWETGATCVHMLRFHLKKMGHKVPAVPKLSGPVAAKRELKKRGWDSVEAMLDDLLEPIAVAAMLPGDVSVVPGEGGIEAVYISLGSTAIGYAEDVEGLALFTEPGKVFEKAWRV